MQSVHIYTSPACGFCSMAKRLLKAKSVSFTETDISRDPSKRQEMLSRASGRHTVPQIFVGKTHVGGWDGLMALARAGKLGKLLSAA